tara:strand:+ start:1105 stop:1752 length:648 start_codon:yes stop_codon:yes gene_type:complete
MNYSFRKKNKIVKYVVIHYTGMKNLKLAYNKLSNINSDVSIHYLISRGGLIYNMLCPKFKAWHAGISKWKKNTNINDHSIGIELENEGHDYEYLNFTKKQYLSLKKLANFLKKNYFITDPNFIFHSDISPNRKKDPGEKFNLNKIGIDRFRYLNTTKNMSYKINDMLSLYGFHKSDIKYNQKYCIMSVKRSLNYKKISPNISKNFIKNFYNLLFH